jgi:predicted Zn-dependent protease
MGGSSKPPGPSDQQRKNEAEALKIQREQLELAKKPIELPNIEPPKPLPPPPPPAQESGEVAQKMEDERRKAARRTNTARGTIFAGETGGLGGKKSLLG